MVAEVSGGNAAVKVVAFKRPVNEHALLQAENILARVKSGEAVGIAVVLLNTDETLTTFISESPNHILLLSGATRLLHHLNRTMDNTAVPND